MRSCGTFQDAISSLAHSIKDAESLQNISVPLSFICLLHLANEKNLAFEADDTMGNFQIVQNLQLNKRNF